MVVKLGTVNLSVVASYVNPVSEVNSPLVVVNTTLPAVDPADAAGKFVN